MKNRQFKFRAWDKSNNKMLYPIDIFNSDLFYEDDENGELHLNKIIDSYGVREELELMQFTGLTDKNGKEIFGGDIVEYEWGTMLSGNSGEKKWGVVVQTKYGNWIIVSGKDFLNNNISRGCPFDNDFRHKESEQEQETVVGNIFENPNFIK